jgi:hypothetical protein
VLLVVDSDRHARISAALARRFQPDYRVLTADSPVTALETLERLADSREDVVLIAADLRLPGFGMRRFGPPLSCRCGSSDNSVIREQSPVIGVQSVMQLERARYG